MASKEAGIRKQTAMAIKAGGAFADSALAIAHYRIVHKGVDGKVIIVQRLYII